MSSTSDIDKTTKKSITSFFNDETSPPIQKVDINTDIKQATEQNYTEIVSNIYKQILNREPDLGGLKNYSNQLKFGIITEEKLRSILKESEEYKSKFNSPISPETSTKSPDIITQSERHLVYCMICTDRLNEIKPYIESVLQYVNKFVFVDGGSTDGTLEYIKELSSKINKTINKIVLIQKPWKDMFSQQRNNYLDYLRSQNYKGWVLTSDSDEHFPKETLEQLRTHIDTSSDEYTGIKFQVEDIIVDDDDRTKVISKKVNEYWKPLMFKFSPEIHYEGEPHETLVGSDLRWITTNLIYQHIRSNLHILSRACENYFISNSNRYSDRWAEFRYLCTKNNIITFKDYWTLFQEHKLPKEVEDWLTRHKDDNFDSGDTELRETYLLYNEVLPKRKRKQELLNISTKELTNNQSPEIIIPNIEISANTSPSIKQSEYELISHHCEQCSSPNEALLELIVHHKHSLTMCKKCWLNLADYIKKRTEEN